jgi:major intracellular serine protease
MTKFRLIPYKVESIVEHIKEIPEGVKMVEAPEIWEKSKKGAGVIVAVIDTGCQTNHPDLKEAIIGGRNFSDDGKPEDFSDNEGHGTHVAGTIGAIINEQGVVGVAPKVSLLILKVFDKDGSAQNENVIKAIDYAISYKGPNGEKVRVINMSLGSSHDDENFHAAVKRAVDDNILVVCAAGNEGDSRDTTDEVLYPAAYPECVCVGAIDFNKNMAPFSSSNDEVDLVAPGVGILSTFPIGIDDANRSTEPGYAILRGTSMASPHVAGAAALIINQCKQDFGRDFTESEVYAQLIKRTVRLGHGEKEEGNGLLSLAKS